MAARSFQATGAGLLSHLGKAFSSLLPVFLNIQARINTLFADKNVFEPVRVITKVTGSLCCCHDAKPGKIKIEKIQFFL